MPSHRVRPHNADHGTPVASGEGADAGGPFQPGAAAGESLSAAPGLETASERVLIDASPGLLAQMDGRWSPPLQVRAERDQRGQWHFVFRQLDDSLCPAPRGFSA